ncbi:MAG: endonuclease III [Syntrophales bacterium]|nr:endonuclease III [Syntrophales bacterium]
MKSVPRPIMKDENISAVIRLMKEYLHDAELPIVSHLAETRHDPFLILISTLLSLRTKDEVTEEATDRLFALAKTPEQMLALSAQRIERAIYPAGFYHNKARTILDVCRLLIDKFSSKVPDDLDTLLTIKGVGRKTANLVMTLGFDKDGICVDTHVHRISNRLGYVHTKNPDETEFALREKLPQPYWKIINTLMVSFGQRVCRPISPLCSTCPLRTYCDRVGVTKSR